MTKRERIFAAGAALFAERSYGSVGIRDIARKADVNSAMISYYFGGKGGLLQEIFAAFCTRVLAVTHECFGKAADHFELCDIAASRFLKVARRNRDVFLIGLRELNHDSAELQGLREELHEESHAAFEAFLQKTGIKNTRSDRQGIIGFGAIIAMIFSD